MDTAKIEWSERFNIGVDVVDKAHRRLFSIVGRIIALNNHEDSEKARFACKEGIKYFKSYAEKHFSEEEAYMRGIHYGGYDMHKKVHDDMRDKTLPALEMEMESSDYSSGSIQHFLGICLGWLSAHILIEDHAIIGKAASKWRYVPHENEEEILEKAVTQIILDLFGLNARLIGGRYRGENFGTAVYFCLTYTTAEGKKVQAFLGYEGQLLLHMLSAMVGRPILKIDRMVVDAAGQISQKIMNRLGSAFNMDNPFQKPEVIAPMSQDHLSKAFQKAYPRYSMLFDTGAGYFVLCIKN